MTEAGLALRTNEHKYHAARGLRSGERNTNFTNSVLNRVQIAIV